MSVAPSLIKRLGSLLAAPHLFLAISFALAWWAPRFPLAADPGSGRWIMIGESILLFASILVGSFIEVSYVFFPLIMLATIALLISVGKAAFSWAMLGFVWGVIAAFVEGLRAHRGEFGFARENPAHPHRRYDRVALVYLATLPICPLLWIAGNPSRWIIWGTIYFTLQTAADSVLRDAIDRIPRAILRRMQSKTDPELAARIGLCRTCMYVQPAIPAREGRHVRCVLSTRDSRFAEFPHTPLSSCEGFRSRE